MIIQKKAYAKINLYLRILDKRPDGYHNIYTVMQKISLCDDIKININQSKEQNINIICSDKNIPTDKSNTVYKAADLYCKRLNISTDITIITIEITKKIPSQSGLGGGSSDAAAVLLGLNEYFDFALPEKDLIKIAAKIGADVPFFVKNLNCAICEGIGEIVTPVNFDMNLSELFCLIVKPVYNISTKQAYDDWDKAGTKQVREALIHNDFAELIFSQNKNIHEIKEFLLKSKAIAAELSGSGSALFGIFSDFNNAENIKNILNQKNDIEFCDIFDFMC